MNQELYEVLRISTERLVLSGISDYENQYEKIKISEIKADATKLCLELTLIVLDRLESGDPVDIDPFKNILLDVLFKLEPDVKVLGRLIGTVFDKLIEFIKEQPNFIANTELVRSIKEYSRQIKDYALSYEFYLSSAGIDIVRSISQYDKSTLSTSLSPVEFNSDTRTSYTLFPSSRYWDSFKILGEDNSYSPLGYNLFVRGRGFPQYQIPISYSALIVYNDELYKLNPDVASPTRNSFVENEWTKYSSRVFNKSQSFKTLYSERIQLAFRKFTEAGFDINSIISDSSTESYDTLKSPDERMLSATFGGMGKQIFQSTRDLNKISSSFGGYEGSPVGGIEYLTLFSEYLISSAYGKQIVEAYDTIGGSSTFGKFEQLFLSRSSNSAIPGLKFLEGFSRLLSFRHGQKIPAEINTESSTIVYNPLYAQFGSGVSDRFVSLKQKNNYVIPPRVDLLLFSIENLYRRSLFVGDTVVAVTNTLDDFGKPAGYEGLGSIKTQLKELQRVFPPTSYMLDEYSTDNKIKGGFSGAIRYLLNTYSRFSKAVIDPVFPGKSFEFFGSWVEKMSNKLEEILDQIKHVGVTTSSFIPNLSFRNFQSEDSELIEFLRSLGFGETEINLLFKAQSFEELVKALAPFSDSSDLKSFFKAYELSQLIYEFGGEEGVNAYLSFLYSSNKLDSLLNILSLSQKDKSKQSYIDIDKYPKLIGLLIGLTYAVDPQQISKFNSILSGNELSLLDQINFLYEGGEDNIIKSPGDIDLLVPLTSQMIGGLYERDAFASQDINYPQANKHVPIALKQWTEEIGDNLGKVDSLRIIRDLYDQSVGLTPKELLSILNYPDSATKLGAILDGVMGGTFTKFLKYATLSGLSVKLQKYKNSYQTNNFQTGDVAGFYSMPSLISSLEKLLESTRVIGVVFSSQLDYSALEDTSFSRALDPIVFSQNKSFEALTEVTSNIKPASFSSAGSLSFEGDIVSEAKTSDIMESPGIGNSRVPNRVSVKNSITPEQYRALSNPQSKSVSMELAPAQDRPLIDRFIKISSDTTLANTLNIVDETVGITSSRSKKRYFQTRSKYQSKSSLSTTTTSRPYQVPEIYRESEIKTQALGANYIVTDDNQYSDETKAFSPVDSCKRFGGSDCETLYPQETLDGRCVNNVNKSLYPESYTEVPGLANSSVPIDRPLGTFSDYKPLGKMIPSSSFGNTPAYYDLLPENATPGIKNEPILESVITTPLAPDSGNGSLSEYYNSEFGIREFIRAKLEESSEFNCATLDSPFHYQACMNVMKCKRFSAPTFSKYFLDFCPRAFSGGRLKK